MTSSYQKHFNKVISKMRIALSATLMDYEPLMRTLVKILYDFSDDIREEGLINDERNKPIGRKGL